MAFAAEFIATTLISALSTLFQAENVAPVKTSENITFSEATTYYVMDTVGTSSPLLEQK